MVRQGTKERATFSLSLDVIQRLEKTVPKRARSRYVDKAIANALHEDAKAGFRKFLDDLPKITTGEDSTELLRRLRKEWDGREDL